MQLSGRPPELVGEHGRDLRVLGGNAFRRTARPCVSAFGTEIFRVHGREHNPVDRAVVHRLDPLLLEIGVPFGLADEQQVAAVACGIERAPDDVAGEGSGRTVSETNPIVWLVPVRRLRDTMFGR